MRKASVEPSERAAGLGELDLARLADEERLADALLQHLDLVADGGLRHRQFLRGSGEGEKPRGSLEGADGGKRWKAHTHKPLLCMLSEVRLAGKAAPAHM